MQDDQDVQQHKQAMEWAIKIITQVGPDRFNTMEFIEQVRQLTQELVTLQRWFEENPVSQVKEIWVSGTILEVETQATSMGGKKLNLGKIVIKPDIGQYPTEVFWIDRKAPDYERLMKIAEDNRGQGVRILKRSTLRPGDDRAYSTAAQIIPATQSEEPEPIMEPEPAPQPAPAATPKPAPQPEPEPEPVMEPEPVVADAPQSADPLAAELDELETQIPSDRLSAFQAMRSKSPNTPAALKSLIKVARGWIKPSTGASRVVQAVPKRTPEPAPEPIEEPEPEPIEEPEPEPVVPAKTAATAIRSALDVLVRQHIPDGLPDDQLDLLAMLATVSSATPAASADDLTKDDLPAVEQILQKGMFFVAK